MKKLFTGFLLMLLLFSTCLPMSNIKAATDELETPPDDETVYLNSGIDNSSVNSNTIKEDWVKKLKTSPPSKTLGVTHQTQDNNYFCAPTAATILSNYLGYRVGQAGFASIFNTNPNTGTDAGPHLANGLNSKTGYNYNFQWVWHSAPNVSTIRNHIITGILYGSPVMVNTAEGPGDYHISGHENYGYIYHYGVVDGYNEYTDTCRYVDPGAGYFYGFLDYQNVSFTSMSNAAGTRGYVW